MIELTTGIIMIASTLYGGEKVAISDTIIEQPAMVQMKDHETMTLEQYVREYFKDIPELAEVSRCESNFRQFDTNGKILRGRVIPDDIGLMQINEFYHGERAKKNGYNLYTVDGNLAYAKFLYEKEGMSPWSASKPCWNKAYIAMVSNR